MLYIIKTIFADAETVSQLHQRFYQRCQNSNDSLQTYSLVIMTLIDRITKKDKKVLGDKDLMLKERFIDDVSDSLLSGDIFDTSESISDDEDKNNTENAAGSIAESGEDGENVNEKLAPERDNVVK